jgi:hypothetical protein
MKQTDTDTLVQALRILARDIHCEDGIATSVIREAADKIAQFHVALKTLSTWAETAEENQVDAKNVLYVTEDCLGRSSG